MVLGLIAEFIIVQWRRYRGRNWRRLVTSSHSQEEEGGMNAAALLSVFPLYLVKNLRQWCGVRGSRTDYTELHMLRICLEY